MADPGWARDVGELTLVYVQGNLVRRLNEAIIRLVELAKDIRRDVRYFHIVSAIGCTWEMTLNLEAGPGFLRVFWQVC